MEGITCRGSNSYKEFRNCRELVCKKQRGKLPAARISEDARRQLLLSERASVDLLPTAIEERVPDPFARKVRD